MSADRAGCGTLSRHPPPRLVIAPHADPHDYEGRTVIDSNGHKVGRVEMVYVDPESMALQWGLVRTGLVGRSAIVPLVEAAGDERAIRIPHTREQIALAPRVNPRSGQLTEAEEQQLAHHYGLGYSRATSASGLVEPRRVRAPGVKAVSPSAAGTAEATSMVRSEERMAVRLVRRPLQRVRLVKRVVREPASTTVTIRREEIRIERGLITESEVGTAPHDIQMVPSERVITLMREEPVIEKRVLPVERVHLAKDVTVEERTVHAELRHEQVDVERVSNEDGRG